MHELEAHLRAHPDDLAAWSVYADWLLEHGDARGDLVRRHRESTKEERARWRGPIPEKVATDWRFGFVIELDLPLDPRTPALLSQIFADPAGRLVSSVKLHPTTWEEDTYFKPRDHEIEASFDTLGAILDGDLQQLRSLGIRYIEMSDEHVDALANAPLSITELDLRYTKLTDERFARIAQAPWFAGVRRLHLQHNPLTDHVTKSLASLDYLDIRDTQIKPHAGLATKLVAYSPARTIRAARASAPTPAKLVDGLSISSQRTERFRVVRFLDKRSISRSIARDCMKVPELPGFVGVYVDPEEWSFRTFENIIPLDRLIPSVTLQLAGRKDLAHEIHRFTLDGNLPAFDELPLYTEPMNQASRGGRRYIFHAAALADALTKAVAKALPALKRFSHVNPVFRCNRFEPGDEPFRRHFDTPYYDAARNHLSQYTLLIYLTGGSASPALKIENLAIDSIEAMQCFVFHQGYEHAGAPFIDGRKVFLRTELVFEDLKAAHDSRIAALFSKACYLTGESVRTPELAVDADRAYNAVAAAHWSGVLPPRTEPFVHKQFRGVHWLANGYDFWFPKALPLADCAAITLLDYFNCKIAGTPFRTLAPPVVVRDIDPDAFLAALPAPPQFPTLDKAALFPAPEQTRTCCPGHSGVDPNFDPSTSSDVIDLYARAQTFARARLDPAPIVMLGEEIFLDAARFVVEGNKLHVLSADRLAPVNFASCWNCRTRPPNYLDVDLRANVLQPLVPPILWETTRETQHLMFDFFRNGWAVEHVQYDVPVPRIRDVDYETADEAEMPWLEVGRRADPTEGLPAVRHPFWAYTLAASPLIRELYRDRRQ